MENCLIVIAGLPGTGKTTTSKKLAEKLGGCILIAQNDIRREHGMKKMPKTQEAVLREIDRMTMQGLVSGKGVIFESGNRYSFRRHQMYGIASGCGKNVVVIETVCSERLAKKRIKQRPKGDELISDPRDTKVYDRIAELWENIEIDFKYPGEDHVSYIIFNTEDQKITKKIITPGMEPFINEIEKILSFTNIKAVGFDLDNTLYPQSSEIDDIIRDNIAKKILEKKPELKDIKQIRSVYDKRYEEVGSWTKLLQELGYDNPKDIMYKCLLEADILPLIKRDDVLVEIIKGLAQKYRLFLLTNTPKNLSIPRLEKIGIDHSVFNYTFFGGDEGFSSKTDPTTFKNLLNQIGFLPEECVYIGDSLKSDILPPKLIGMKTISIGNIDEADFSIEHIHEIKKLLL